MSDFVTTLISFVSTVISLVEILVNIVLVIVRIITSPYLMLFIVFITANIYTIVVSQTRKEIIINYGKFFEKAGKAGYSVIKAAIPLLTGIIQAISTMIAGLAANPIAGIIVAGIISAIIIASILLK